MNDDHIDEEDIILSECYIVICFANCGGVITDRVYRSFDLSKKRADYLNKLSNGRCGWVCIYSQLGK